MKITLAFLMVYKKTYIEKKMTKDRSPKNGINIKKYKNKLTHLMWFNEKEYQNEFTAKNANSIKETWVAINEIIKNRKKYT